MNRSLIMTLIVGFLLLSKCCVAVCAATCRKRACQRYVTDSTVLQQQSKRYSGVPFHDMGFSVGFIVLDEAVIEASQISACLSKTD